MYLPSFIILAISTIKNTITFLNMNTKEIISTINVAEGPVKAITCNNGIFAVTLNKSSISLINMENLSLVKNIDFLNSPIDGVLTSDNKYLYLICRDMKYLFKIDLHSDNSTLIKLSLEFTPSKIVYVEALQKLYLAGSDSLYITVINCDDFTLKKEILINNVKNFTPIALAKTNNNDYVYFTSINTGIIAQIDTSNDTLTEDIYYSNSTMYKSLNLKISPNDHYFFIGAISNDTGVIFQGSIDYKINVKNFLYLSLKIDDIFISSDSTVVIAYSSEYYTIYVLDLETLTIIHAFKLLGLITTVLIDDTNHYFYAMCTRNNFNSLIAIDYNSGKIIDKYIIDNPINSLNGQYGTVTIFNNMISLSENNYVSPSIYINNTSISHNLSVNLIPLSNTIITGKLLDTSSIPMSNSTIFFQDIDGRKLVHFKTDIYGVFTFKLNLNLTPYEIRYTIFSPEFSTYKTVLIYPNKTNDLGTIILRNDELSSLGTITGATLSLQNTPISNVSITVYKVNEDNSLQFISSNSSSTTSKFNIYGLSLGNYLLKANKPSYIESVFNISIDKLGKVDVATIKLLKDNSFPTGNISGNIENFSDRDINGGIIELYTLENGLKKLIAIETNINNNFYSFNNLSPNDYYVSFKKIYEN